MKFEIKEYHNKLKSKNLLLNFLLQYFVLPIFLILLIFVILPILFTINIFSKKEKIEEVKNEFEKKFKNENVIIERKSVDERDYPDDLDYGEDDVYLFIYKSNPKLSIFENRYFDYNFHETEFGIYLEPV